MTDPYRDSGHREVAQAPRDRGIVGDVISQFADPHAFYRELVQNSIDADSPDVAIELDHDDTKQQLRVVVRDRGAGMTRDIIENQLLVLFRSTKEKDSTKIGKFGIGFKSVLAPEPDVVIVSSARDGKRLTVHLYPDLSYELFDAGRATQTGTSVELQISMSAEQARTFVEASEAALRRWCRHASVPITFTDRDARTPSPVRIDQPLGIDGALVEVRRTTSDGLLTVVAGLTHTPRSYLGFFNHGLTLVETADSLGSSVSVKVQDSRLGHTLSRDDVRRDEHYDRAIEHAREVVRETLARAVAERIRQLAEAGGGTEYSALVAAAIDAKLTPDVWYFPLLEPHGDQRAIAATELGRHVWCAAASSEVTRAVAATGSHVLRSDDQDVLRRALAMGGATLGEVHQELTSLALVTPSDSDTALLALLGELLDAVHRRPSDIVLRKLDGVRGDLLSVAIPDAGARLVSRDEAAKSPFALFGRRALAISTSHPLVDSAREAEDPRLAASHLARAILLQHGLLDATRSAKLLELSLAAIGVDA